MHRMATDTQIQMEVTGTLYPALTGAIPHPYPTVPATIYNGQTDLRMQIGQAYDR